MISLIRCDDRLIHGQCMTRLVPHYKVKKIIAVDNFTATNSTMKFIFEKAAMPGTKVNVYTEQDCIEPIREAVASDVSTMIVFRFPTIAKMLFDNVEGLLPVLMVGPVVRRDDTKVVQDGTYVSEEEIQAFKYMVEEKNVEVYFQTVPDMKRLDWKDVKDSLL